MAKISYNHKKCIKIFSSSSRCGFLLVIAHLKQKGYFWKLPWSLRYQLDMFCMSKCVHLLFLLAFHLLCHMFNVYRSLPQFLSVASRLMSIWVAIIGQASLQVRIILKNILLWIYLTASEYYCSFEEDVQGRHHYKLSDHLRSVAFFMVFTISFRVFVVDFFFLKLVYYQFVGSPPTRTTSLAYF